MTELKVPPDPHRPVWAFVALPLTGVVVCLASAVVPERPRAALMLGYLLGIAVCTVSDVLTSMYLRRQAQKRFRAIFGAYLGNDTNLGGQTPQGRSEGAQTTPPERPSGAVEGASDLADSTGQVVARIVQVRPGAYVSLVTPNLDPLERLSIAYVLRSLAEQLE